MVMNGGGRPTVQEVLVCSGLRRPKDKEVRKGSVVKQRNFARRIFLSTDVCTRMREAKSRHDMNTAGVKGELRSEGS